MDEEPSEYSFDDITIGTKKNSPAEAFLPNCGFKKENEYWVYDLNNPIKPPNHLLLEVE